MGFFRIASAIIFLAATLFVASPPLAASATTVVGDTTQADFDLGSTADALTSSNGGGGVGLSPGSANFTETPGEWLWTSFGSGSSVSPLSGRLSIEGGRLDSPNLLMHGKSVVYDVTFDRGPNQSVGLSVPGSPNLAVGLTTGSSPDGFLWLQTYNYPNQKTNWTYSSAPVRLKIESTGFNVSFSRWTGSSWSTPLVSLNVIQRFASTFASDGSIDGKSLKVDSISSNSFLSLVEECDASSEWKGMGNVNAPPVIWNNGICEVGSPTYGASYKSPLSPTKNMQIDFWGTLGLRANGTFSLESGTNPFGFFNGNANNLSGMDARTSSGSYGLQLIYKPLPSSLAGVQHHYRIKVLSDRVELSIPDVPSIPMMTALGSTSRDYFTIWARNANVDKVVITPLPGSASNTGSFTSRILSPGSYSSWDAIDWNGVVPANTTASFELRTGNVSIPDITWSSWTPVDKTQAALGLKGRYGQYRVKFTSAVERSIPEVTGVTFETTAIPGTFLVDSSITDFNQGITNTAVVVPDSADGSVELQGAYALPSGQTLPPGWDFTGPGTATANGGLYLDGKTGILTTRPSGANSAVTFDASFAGGPDQSIGFKSVNDPAGVGPQQVWFGYSAADGNLYANTMVRSDVSTTNPYYIHKIQSVGIGLGRRNYTIDLDSHGNANFYLDGVFQIALPYGPERMYPFIYDSTQDGVPLTIDGISSAAALDGTFTSRVLGTAGNTIAGVADWNSTIPSGSSLVVRMRSGNTPSPDVTWTAWKQATDGNELPVSGTYVQYQVYMTAGPGAARPSWQDITFQTFPS